MRCRGGPGGRIMIRALILVLILGTPVLAKDRSIEIKCSNYTLDVRCEAIGEIPLYRVDMDEVHSQESFMAYLAQEEHPLACRMRDTQDRLAWYMAHIWPDEGATNFKWPGRQALIFLFNDTPSEAAESIIAYPPDVKTHHAITEIYPGGFACLFSDLDTHHMAVTHKDLFIGIPRRKRAGKLVEIRIIHNEGGS